MSSDWQADIIQFHKKLDLLINEKPTIISKEKARLRKNLIKEEVIDELLKAIDENNLEQIADGIVDSIVVLIGTAISYGINIQPIWDEIYRSNMTKEPFNKRKDGKVLKGPNYSPPNIKSIIDEQIRK